MAELAAPSGRGPGQAGRRQELRVLPKRYEIFGFFFSLSLACSLFSNPPRNYFPTHHTALFFCVNPPLTTSSPQDPPTITPSNVIKILTDWWAGRADNSQAELDAKKAELSDLITEVLRRQPHLCYFQGYHDICQVLLLVLPATSSLAVAKEKGGAVPVPTPPTPVGLRASTAARLSGLRIRDFMLPSLGPAVTQLRLIPEILARADAALCARLARTEPYFALPDTLTMFAHNVRRLPDIARVFALLAREPAFALYLFAALASSRRDRLLAEHSPEDEPDMLHFALSKLPQSFDDGGGDGGAQEADLDAVIAAAADLASAHPPESLPSWRGAVSRHSALKTARSVRACAREQTLDDGRAHFDAQLRELRRADRVRALRARYDTWPNRLALLAVVLGVAAAVYVRQAGDPAPSWAPLGSLWGYWGV